MARVGEQGEAVGEGEPERGGIESVEDGAADDGGEEDGAHAGGVWSGGEEAVHGGRGRREQNKRGLGGNKQC